MRRRSPEGDANHQSQHEVNPQIRTSSSRASGSSGFWGLGFAFAVGSSANRQHSPDRKTCRLHCTVGSRSALNFEGMTSGPRIPNICTVIRPRTPSHKSERPGIVRAFIVRTEFWGIGFRVIQYFTYDQNHKE